MRASTALSLLTFIGTATAAAVAQMRSYFWQTPTNAQRLAAGQPPLRPRNLYGTRTRTAPRQVPSAGPEPEQWVRIELHDAQMGAPHGYLHFDDGATMNLEASSTPWPFVFARPESAPDGWDVARELQFPSSGPADDATRRSWLGVMHISTLLYGGEMSMGAGSEHFGFLVETSSQGPPGTPANEWIMIETSMFIVDPASGAVSIEWTNPDGSRVPVYPMWCQGSNPVFAVTGDVALATEALARDMELICSPQWSFKMVAASAP
ncbi:hypothetical protein AURDEDRAFT_111596 [Auricularia subglabra TFB-10046 SS5]|nr:hypothetical protein AURDEDRAFT_111596 [Auricularia subglabra TFB-10046 SS5]